MKRTIFAPKRGTGQGAMFRAGAVVLALAGAAAAIELSLQAASAVSRLALAREGGRPAPRAILCLGESTTAPPLFGRDVSWPSLLQGMIDERLGPGKVRVVNRGFPSTNTSAILARLPDQLERHKPEAVVAMMGVNDPSWFGLVKFKRAADAGPGAWLARTKTAEAARWASHEILSRLRSASSGHPGPAPDARGRCGELFNAGLPRAREAEIACAREARERPKSLEPGETLGRLRYTQGRYDESAPLLERAFAGGSRKPLVLLSLAKLHRQRGRLADVAKVCAPLLEDGRAPAAAAHGCALMMANIAWQDRAFGDPRAYVERALRLDPEYVGAGVELEEPAWADPGVLRGTSRVTAENYGRLRALLAERRTPLVAVQYPLEDAGELSRLLGGGAGARVVDNAPGFRAALARGRYEDLFVDRFGGRWGHCTEAGNRIIAENVYAALRSEGVLK
ncbi:MAG: hypothetical protein HY059_09495 [Proteobacteria bacterium]|nr:hypothetical protein [Pseudomonadota bacterium]